MDDSEPEQDKLFKMEGPDEDGCVWICSSNGRGDWCHNLGPEDKGHRGSFSVAYIDR